MACAVLAVAAPVRADCPAAPIADPDDMAISFLAANGVQAASASLLASSVKEGTLVYDDAADKLKICDGNNWIDVGSGSGADTLASLSCSAGQIAKYNGTAWACAADGGGASPFRGALVKKSANQSISSGTNVAVAFDAEEYDIGDWHDNSTNNSRLTVPAGVSRVRISAQYTNSSLSGQTIIEIRKNGGNFVGKAMSETDTAGVDSVNATTPAIEVSAGDYFEAWVFLTDGETLTPSQNVWFAIEEVGGGSDTLAGLSCATNEIPKWNGTAWACAADGGGSGSGGFGAYQTITQFGTNIVAPSAGMVLYSADQTGSFCHVQIFVNGVNVAIDKGYNSGSSAQSVTAPVAAGDTYQLSNDADCTNVKAFFVPLIGGGSATAAGDGGQIQFNDGADAFAADASLHWDNTNKRLGIGTASPGSRLQVAMGASGATPHSFAELTLEDDSNAGLNILTPNTDSAYILFGDPENSTVGRMVYNHANNSLYFGTNGNTTGNLLINSAGYVGIGTTTPGATLDIRTAGASLWVGQATSPNPRLELLDAGSYGRLQSYNGPLTINPLGNNVGIGTATPEKKLDLRGEFVIYPNTQNAGSRLISRSINADGRWALDVRGTSGGSDTQLVVARDGYVGFGHGEFSSSNLNAAIGVSGDLVFIPKLRIGGQGLGPANISGMTIGASNNTEWLYSGSYPNGANYYSIKTVLDSASSAERAPLRISAHDLSLWTGAAEAERMRIASNGNVGIGATNPIAKLDVRGAGANAGIFLANSDWVTGSVGSGLRIEQGASSGNTYTRFQAFTAGAGGAGDIVLNLAGNVGIGTTSPARRLTVSADAGNGSGTFGGGVPLLRLEGNQANFSEPSIEFVEQTNAPIASIATKNIGSGAGDLIFSTRQVGAGSLTERMRIKDTGNVGIGTATPTAKLSVAGTLETTGNVTAGGFDFKVGSADQTTRGDSGASRALVKYTGSMLVINWSGDFTGGTVIQGAGNSNNFFVSGANNGNVGIGTLDPNQGKVEVKGGSVCVDTNSDDNATSCITAESDARLKKNIEVIPHALETLNKLRGVLFDWRWDEYPEIKDYKAIGRDAGVIAQEVEVAFPQGMGEELNGFKTVRYDRLVPLMIESIKELKADNDNLRAELNAANDNYEELRREVEALKSGH